MMAQHLRGTFVAAACIGLLIKLGLTTAWSVHYTEVIARSKFKV